MSPIYRACSFEWLGQWGLVNSTIAGKHRDWTAGSLVQIFRLRDCSSIVPVPVPPTRWWAAETAVYLTSKHPDYAVLAAHIAISNFHKETKKNFSQVIKDLYEYGDVFYHLNR